MVNNKITIIGGGIAGLSAGCYLQMNGYETTIFELHNVPGGLCTSWNKKGYTFDGCIHWLVGSGPSDDFYKLWNELIDMKKLKIVNCEEYIRFEDKDHKVLRIFRDVDKLEKEMIEVAPEDEELIKSFTKDIRRCSKIKLPIDKAPEVYNLYDIIKFLFKIIPFLRIFKRWGKTSLEEYANMYKNPLVKRTILSMFVPRMSMLFIIMSLAWMHKKSAGYPVGGSLKFARLIEQRYKELGGRIRYNSKVIKILVENNKAKGIKLENGEIYESDIVISAADSHYTIYEMLDGKYINNKISDYYKSLEIFSSLVQISLGVSRTFEKEPGLLFLSPEKPVIIDESSKQNEFGVRVFNFDPTLAEKGKTCITAVFPTYNYEYWENLRKNNKEKYKKEKERIAEEVIEILDKRFGNIKKNVEVYDVATPSTYIRYTNNWKGSFEGWILTPESVTLRIKKSLPGLENFYMAGQWVEPGGGIPAVMMSGRNVAQIICKKDKKKFNVLSYLN